MDTEREVIESARARASALAAGDAERLSGLLHEDFRWTSHVGAIHSREDYLRRNTEGYTVWHSQELHDVDVVVVGDTAVLYAEVTDVVTRASDNAGGDGGATKTFRMPMTQVWVRSDAEWRCLGGHAGPRRAG